MKHSLLNKKVILLTPDLKKIIAVGNLYYIGENKMLNWKLQATVNRTPHKIKHLGQVIEHSDEKIKEMRAVKLKN